MSGNTKWGFDSPASILLRELALARKFATQNKSCLTSTLKSESAKQNALRS